MRNVQKVMLSKLCCALLGMGLVLSCDRIMANGIWSPTCGYLT